MLCWGNPFQKKSLDAPDFGHHRALFRIFEFTYRACGYVPSEKSARKEGTGQGLQRPAIFFVFRAGNRLILHAGRFTQMSKDKQRSQIYAYELHLHRTSGTCDTLQGLSPMSDVLLSYGLKGDVGASPIQATRRRSLERNGKSFHRLMCIYMCRSRDTWPRRMNSISIKVINIKLDFLY